MGGSEKLVNENYRFTQVMLTGNIVIMLLFVGFFFMHIAQVVRAGWNNFSAVITGFEVKKRD